MLNKGLRSPRNRPRWTRQCSRHCWHQWRCRAQSSRWRWESCWPGAWRQGQGGQRWLSCDRRKDPISRHNLRSFSISKSWLGESLAEVRRTTADVWKAIGVIMNAVTSLETTDSTVQYNQPLTFVKHVLFVPRSDHSLDLSSCEDTLYQSIERGGCIPKFVSARSLFALLKSPASYWVFGSDGTL